MTSQNPIQPFITHQGTMVLDGGLATELEGRGCDLHDSLWSARLLLEDPDIIQEVHRDFLVAGADCITTASYQGSFQGFAERGIDQAKSSDLFSLSSTIAVQARDDFWAGIDSSTNRLKPIVAGSIGPYGAYRTDGSEYTGNYDLDEDGLFDFHRERWHVQTATPVDLLAAETIPSLPETRAIRRLIDQTAGVWAWVSFSCRDGGHLQDGTPLAVAAEVLKTAPNLAAVGVNCTAPRFIPELLSILKSMQPHPVIVYPNSGETFNPIDKGWNVGDISIGLAESAPDWVALGAAGIGGCCRVNTNEITAIRNRVINRGGSD